MTDNGADDESGVPEAQGSETQLRTIPWTESNVLAAAHVAGRYLLASVLLFYGFSKVVGVQFLVTESMLDMRLRDMDGLVLTWAYHGSSEVLRYGTATAEVGTGLLLLFRRTSRLGLLAAVVVGLHLLLVNLAYPIALPVVLLVLLLTAGLIAMDLPAYRAILNDHLLRPPALGSGPARGGRLARSVTAVAGIGVIGATFGFQAYLGAVNVPDEELSGVWRAVDDEEIDRFYIDAAPYCAVRPEGSQEVWRGVCFVDEDEGTLQGDLPRRPAPDATEVWELDASYELSDDGQRLHLDDHVRDIEVELVRGR